MTSRFLSFFCAALLWAVSSVASHSQPTIGLGGFWEWRNPVPQGNPLYRVTYGNGIYVAVGESGTILSSGAREPHEEEPIVTAAFEERIPGEAEEWIARESGTRQWLTGATYARGQFVVVGNGGRILTSPNGIDWTCQYSGTDQWLWEVSFFQDRFWTVGSGGTILSSEDATTWHPHPQPNTTFLRSITSNGEMIVAGGNGGTILYSLDGELWDEVVWDETELVVFSAIHSIAYREGQFVAVGASGLILLSLDGVEWKEPEEFVTSEDLWHIANGLRPVDDGEGGDPDLVPHFLVAGAGGTLMSSADGELWSFENTGVFSALRSVANNEARVVMVGSAGRIVRTITEEERGEMEYPPTEDWQDISAGIRNVLFGVTYGVTDELIEDDGSSPETEPVGKIVITGDSGRILRSVGELDEEDFEWMAENASTSNWLRDVTFGDELFVAVGNNATIRTSGDAQGWATPIHNVAGDITAVAYGNERFIAVGRYGRVRLSRDAEGTIWDDATPDNYDDEEDIPEFRSRWLRGVTYGNNLYVAVGDAGRIMTSLNGATWLPRDPDGLTAPLLSVAYGDGKFIAVGRNGLMLSSLNGISWTYENSGTFATLQAISYGNGVWIAVGDWGTILASYDGEVWFEHNSRTRHTLWGLTYVEELDIFIAVGDGGTVVTSTTAETSGLDYWTWVVRQGLTGDDARPEGNPSGDGLANLLKFALGLDPYLPQRHLAPLLEVILDEETDEVRLALLFQEATGTAGVSLSIDASETLREWSDVDYEIEILEELEELHYRLVQFRETHVLGEDDRRFIRLTATQINPFECSPPAPRDP